MEPQLGPYAPLYPPASPFPTVGQPHWEPRPPEAPPGPWGPPRGEGPPGRLDPFSQAFAGRLPGKAWGAGTPVAGEVTPPLGLPAPALWWPPPRGAAPRLPLSGPAAPPLHPPCTLPGPSPAGTGGGRGLRRTPGSPGLGVRWGAMLPGPQPLFQGCRVAFPWGPPMAGRGLGGDGGGLRAEPPLGREHGSPRGPTSPPQQGLGPPPTEAAWGWGGAPHGTGRPPCWTRGVGGRGCLGGCWQGAAPPGPPTPSTSCLRRSTWAPASRQPCRRQRGGGCGQDPPGGATLAWSPWPGLEGDPETQQQVETLLDLACSSALPGGGTNRELALHCLARADGSLTGALELLLLGTPAWPRADPLAGYHYTGSDTWTPRERRLFAKALARHGKDFTRIQQAVPSKRTTQCVEFYYLHKSRLGRARRQMPSEALGSRFPCKLCGKIFPKIKSRNAHMKIHRQQEGWGGSQFLPPPWPPVSPTVGGGHAAAPGVRRPPPPPEQDVSPQTRTRTERESLLRR
ncbi:basic proline-rich protein-like [Aquila chrysaetos chrysaetos]|uniref:basic proline-rich protein-like n=1 Tax=Aquila chrysaetos chrysaetos TaxID=223781 RepID=UPI001B7D4220|nr:basic proline-rich protein-like [Aquila chrysaetos chrysaetos]